MEFRLVYKGLLPSNQNRGGVKEQEHEIRKEFHKQLKKLWSIPPLSSHKVQEKYKKYEIDKTPDLPNQEYKKWSSVRKNIIKPLGGFKFYPLVNKHLKLHAELNVLLLIPVDDIKGSIINSAGDLDNRIKTLFDALTTPPQLSKLPDNIEPSDDERPFFCLLEDDSLITSFSVSSDRLLYDCNDHREVQAIIHVRTKVEVAQMNNIEYGL